MTYAELRPLIKDGDLAFFSGDTLLARAIKHVTKSPWSHVGILFRENGTEGDEDDIVMLHEAVGSGVRAIHLSRKLAMCACPVVIARHLRIVSEVARSAIRRQSHLDLTIRYNKWAILQIYTRIRTKGLIGRRPKWDDGSGLICSELVARAYDKAGYRFNSRFDFFTSPHDLYADPWMKQVGCIQPEGAR